MNLSRGRDPVVAIGAGDRMKRLAILISGRGSNMAALIDAARAGEIDAAIGIVISNRPDAAGLAIAAAAGVATSVVDHRAFADRVEFERSLAAAIDAKRPTWSCSRASCGSCSPAFVARYAGRLLNIHPSLLPAYPGVAHPPPGAGRRGAHPRLHRALRHLRRRLRPDRRASRGDGPTGRRRGCRWPRACWRSSTGCWSAAVRWFCSDRLSIEGSRVRIRGEIADPAVLQAPSDKATNSRRPDRPTGNARPKPVSSH